MKITEDQAFVIDILVNSLIKIALAASSIGGFWYILINIIHSDSNKLSWALAFLESMLTGTLYYIVAHYFPAFKVIAKSKIKPFARKS